MTGLEQERAVFDIFANEEFTALLDKEPTEFEEFMVMDLALEALGFSEMKALRYGLYYKKVCENSRKKHGLPEDADVMKILLKRPVYRESIRLTNDFRFNIRSSGMSRVLYHFSMLL